MAKVIIEYDTSEKTASVTMDGQSLDNFAGASLYPSYGDSDEYSLELTFATRDEANDTRTLTRIVAAECPAARRLFDPAPAAFAGFVVAGSPVEADIASYFNK